VAFSVIYDRVDYEFRGVAFRSMKAVPGRWKHDQRPLHEQHCRQWPGGGSMQRMNLCGSVALSIFLVASPALAQEPNARLKQELLVSVDELQRSLAEMEKSHEALARLNAELVRRIEHLQDESASSLKEIERKISPDALPLVRQLQETQMSFNMQYLGLQQKMQDESRRFTVMSNIMKTKHETAKNAISNIR
jgi:cell division protein FtsB